MPNIAVNTLFEIDQVVSFDESIIVDNLIKYYKVVSLKLPQTYQY